MRLTLLTLLLLPTLAYAQRNATIPDPDPEIERKSFIVDPRFEVNLFAADPLLAKPIQMNFDAAGRLWIASSEVYPQIKPGQKANDKIIILEDTKGTGKADKTTVFADGLLIPTGLLPGDGGVYVANSTELIHLSDTKGIGKADKKRIVLSGFGTEDTHHMLHTLRWGPDGRMYMMQSIYIHSHIETPHGPRRLNAGGIWRFKPETMELDVFARGWVNPWGLAFDRYGQAFVTDGAGGEGINYVIPGGYYVTAADAKRVFPGLNPGSPKFCGLEIVSGRHLPDDWQGNLITNDFRGHRVCRFIVKDDGAGFASIEQPELIKSTHPAFRPIDVKMGPDGAIYIADWYNPIIQHGEVDFRDPRRDVTHGRIWRVTAKGRPLVKKPKIEGATTAQLLEALKQPEQWTRDMARVSILRAGVEQVKKVFAEHVKQQEEFSKWHKKFDHVTFMDEFFRESERLDQELSMLKLLVGCDLTVEAYKSIPSSISDGAPLPFIGMPSTAFEKNRKGELYFQLLSSTCMKGWILGQFKKKLLIDTDPMTQFAYYINHDAPRIRLQIVRLLAKVQDARALDMALQVLSHPMDRFLDYALWLTVRELEPQWLPAFREGKLKFDDPRHLLFAVQASGSPELVEPLLKYLQQNDLKGETADALWNQVAQLGGPNEMQLLWDQCVADDPRKKLSPAQRFNRVQALEKAASQRQMMPQNGLSLITKIIASNNSAEACAGLRLAGYWKVEHLFTAISSLVTNESVSLEERTAACQALALFGSTKAKDELTKVAGQAKSRPLRGEAIKQLFRLDLAKATVCLTDYLNTSNESELQQLLPVVLQTKNGPQSLAKALENATLPPDVAKIAQRIARSTGQVHQPLIDALAKAGKLNTAKWEATPVVMKDLLEGIAKEGSAARGELIYRRKELNCLKCHGIGGSGGQIGPDMTSIGASAQPDYLIESLLVPSKAIKENYNTTVVSTVDGKVLTGIKQRENKDELIIRDAEGNDVKIPIKDIEGRADGKSLMPEGLVDGLTRGELVDLVRFLTELGKVGNYSVGTTRVARTWQILSPNKTAFDLVFRESVGGIVAKPAGLIWSSEYTTVGGVLPLESIPDTYTRKKGEWSGIDTQIGFARTHLECGTAGEVLLVLNDAKGVQVWLDQQPLEVSKEMKLKLTPGSHVLTLAVNKKERSEGVRVEMKDVAGSSGQARWVLGR